MGRTRTSKKAVSARALLSAASVAGLIATTAGAAAATTPAKEHHRASLPTIAESLVVVTGGIAGHPDWPAFVDSRQIELPANAKVVLTITSFDDGSAPLPKNLEFYDKVSGTKGGTETVDGKTVSSVANADVAHTFTVPGIGLNMVIPAAKDAKSGGVTPAVVTASFTTTKSGSFTWQCYAPCGSGKNGSAGAMAAPGYMTGEVVIG